MPASFVVDADRRLVSSRAWGVLVDADLFGTQDGVRAHPSFEPHFSQIYDFSDVTEMRLTGDAVLNLGRSSPFAVDARRAIIVTSDVAFGMARMYGLASNRASDSFRIFRDHASALSWLGIAQANDDAPDVGL